MLFVRTFHWQPRCIVLVSTAGSVSAQNIPRARTQSSPLQRVFVLCMGYLSGFGSCSSLRGKKKGKQNLDSVDDIPVTSHGMHRKEWRVMAKESGTARERRRKARKNPTKYRKGVKRAEQKKKKTPAASRNNEQSNHIKNVSNGFNTYYLFCFVGRIVR